MTSECTEFVRALRKHPTPEEDILWCRLRGSYRPGVRFANGDDNNESDSVMA
jgi:hypothetical protein